MTRQDDTNRQGDKTRPAGVAIEPPSGLVEENTHLRRLLRKAYGALVRLRGFITPGSVISPPGVGPENKAIAAEYKLLLDEIEQAVDAAPVSQGETKE